MHVVRLAKFVRRERMTFTTVRVGEGQPQFHHRTPRRDITFEDTNTTDTESGVAGLGTRGGFARATGTGHHALTRLASGTGGRSTPTLG